MNKWRRTASSSIRPLDLPPTLALAGGILRFLPTQKPAHSNLDSSAPDSSALTLSLVVAFRRDTSQTRSLSPNLFLAKNTKVMSGGIYATSKIREQILGELRKAVGEEETRGILEGKRRVVASCGSGMTAGVLWLGLNLLGVKGDR